MDLTADEIKKYVERGVDEHKADIGHELATYIEDIIKLKLGDKANFIKVRCEFTSHNGDAAFLNLSIDTADVDLMTMAEGIVNEVLESMEVS